MRWLLGRLGTRVGIALGLALLVAAAIAIGNVNGGRTENPTSRTLPGPLSTVSPTAGDDGVVDVSPSTKPDDEAIAVARSFVTAWLRTDLDGERWRAGLARLSTETLMQNLAGVDPSTVPAARQTGQPRVLLSAPTYVRLSVPMDTGSLILTIFNDDKWLVGEIDWEQA